jgi:hypothetical protein
MCPTDARVYVPVSIAPMCAHLFYSGRRTRHVCTSHYPHTSITDIQVLLIRGDGALLCAGTVEECCYLAKNLVAASEQQVW